MIGKIVLIFALLGFASATLETCKSGGEYCLNHWDCCSKTCLTYLYKCSRIPPNSKSNEMPEIGIRSGFDSVPLSLNDLVQIVYKPQESGRSIGRRRNELSSRFRRQASEETAESQQPSTSGPTACKEIGEKCYFNEDCCSSRCHGFLHQCVT